MFVLPELKKPYGSYEPYIDEVTMRVHHLGHHKTYVENLNRALVSLDYQTERIEDIFEKIQDFPAVVRNNAGGHYNHSVFWTTLNDVISTPSPELLNAIIDKYGVLEDFKAIFMKSALELFGSGWTWLVLKDDGELEIVNTHNQDNPLMADIYKGYPLFGIDLWEHAYYLKHQNKRMEYINDFWSILDWGVVSKRFAQKPEMNQLSSLE